MNKKPSVMLEDVTFDFEESDETLGPHIALTFKMQGGAASGYNKPLLFKSEEIKITPELVELIKSTGEDTTSIEKALYNQTLRSLLREAIEEKSFVDYWDYFYIEDFNDTQVVFYTNDGLYSVGYKIQDTTVELEDIANPVIGISEYVEVEGNILVSEDILEEALKKLDEQVSSILNKSKVPTEFAELVKKNILVNSEISAVDQKDSVIKSEDKKSENKDHSEVIIKNNKGELSVDNPVDIQKAIDEAVAKAVLKATEDATAKAEVEKAELKKSLADLQKAEQDRIQKAYVDVVKNFEFVAEDKLDAVVKALMADPVNSAVIFEALMKAHEKVEAVKAEFSVEKGVTTKSTTQKTTTELVKQAAEVMAARNKNK